MKDLMNVKLFLKNNRLWCAPYNRIDSCKNNSDKTFFIVTKRSVLVPKSVLYQPLLDIEMVKLNKHHISGREFY